MSDCSTVKTTAEALYILSISATGRCSAMEIGWGWWTLVASVPVAIVLGYWLRKNNEIDRDEWTFDET